MQLFSHVQAAVSYTLKLYRDQKRLSLSFMRLSTFMENSSLDILQDDSF